MSLEVMGRQRKMWSADVEEAVVLAVLQGEVSVAEVTRQHGADESLIHMWKTNFLDGGCSRLAGEQQDHAALERENDRFKRIVAEKKLQLGSSRKARRQHRGSAPVLLGLLSEYGRTVKRMSEPP